ncbi:MAG: hypothetical protein Q7S22_07755 [Candidatus Micrarchaeota archaeon]|nr:hypothetical protein [Candidatus Micrarchaeota archaeon]
MDEILTAMKNLGKAAFRTREYAALLGKKTYARLVLHRSKEKGEITPVRNGWWAFPDAMPEAIACEMSKPCYISFHSALALHGLTTQSPRTVQIAVLRNAKKYKIFGMEAKEYKVKQFNSFYRKDNILLATAEKAFADCLLIPRACPDIILIEALDKVDINKIKTMITRIAEKRLTRLMKYAKQNRIG